jgi:hypothetical protein
MGFAHMRYSKGSDWVEISGAADMPMRDLDALYSATPKDAFEIAKGVVSDWSITVKGVAVEVGDVMGLTLAKWDWLRESILKSARDEALDPEA